MVKNARRWARKPMAVGKLGETTSSDPSKRDTGDSSFQASPHLQSLFFVVVFFVVPCAGESPLQGPARANVAAPSLLPAMAAASNHGDPPLTQLRPQAFLLFRDLTQGIWRPVCARIGDSRSTLQTRPRRELCGSCYLRPPMIS